MESGLSPGSYATTLVSLVQGKLSWNWRWTRMEECETH